MGILAGLRTMFGPRRLAGAEDLRDFLESRTAYLVQKSITEYTQARAGMLFSTLMREPIFLEGYERGRWRSFPAAISMTSEMVEGTLREAAGSPPGSLDAGLLRLVSGILARYPEPSGEGEAFWTEALERVARDLAQAALGPPKAVQNIPMLRAGEIFDALPVTDELKQHDFPMFRNTIRFHLTEIKAEFEEKAVPAALVEALSQ
jgi:hypothetical protein